MAIDLGAKRTGIAMGDDETKLVSPVDVIVSPHREALMLALSKAIEQQRPTGLVIGLPVNMDGSEAATAKAVRETGDLLHRQSGLPVFYQDERLTSFAADQQMARTGRTRKEKKELRDALAAAEILRDFFESRSR